MASGEGLQEREHIDREMQKKIGKCRNDDGDSEDGWKRRGGRRSVYVLHDTASPPARDRRDKRDGWDVGQGVQYHCLWQVGTCVRGL